LARRLHDGSRLARAVLARAAFELGVVDPELIADLREARTALGTSAPALAARVDARLAAALQPAEDPMVPVARAREAVLLARSAGDPTALLDTMLSAGSALADYAPLDERRALAGEMIALATDLGHPVIALRGYARLALDSLESGDTAGCDDAIERYAAIANTLRAPHHLWLTFAMRSMRAAMRGDFPAAAALHAQARRIAARSDDPNATTALALAEALHGRETLDDETLGARFDEVVRVTAHVAFSTHVGALLRASTRARRGDLAEARAAFVGIRPEKMLVEDPTFCALAAETVALAIPERALEWAPSLLSRAGRTMVWGLFAPVWEGPMARLAGLVLRALGRLDEAVAQLESARTRAIEVGARPFAARAAVELAETLERRARADDRARALVLRDEARAEARALGMTRLALQIDASGSPPVAAASVTAITLVRDGETWLVGRGEARHRMKDSRGLRILDELVRAPDRDVHVLELATERGADGGDAGPVLDGRAIVAYRARATELRDALDEAERHADSGRAERARAELDALAEQIARGVGLGGRERRAGSATEKARVNVQRRLKDAIDRIAALDPALGTHLEWAVRTGTFCRYRTR
jgi:hypothetical protein